MTTPTTPDKSAPEKGIELLPCPFCGSKAICDTGNSLWENVCCSKESCDLSTILMSPTRWNTRTAQETGQQDAGKKEALEDVKFIRKELGRTWLNQRQRDTTEDIHARLHRIEAALTKVYEAAEKEAK